LYNVDHGASLSIVFPAWLKYHATTFGERLARFGQAVFGTTTADEAIAAMEKFFQSIGAPIRLQEANIKRDEIPKIAENALSLAQKWGLASYTTEVIAQIFTLAA